MKFIMICLTMMLSLEKNAEELQAKYQAKLALEAITDPKEKRKAMRALPAPEKPKTFSPKRKETKEEREKKLRERDEDLTRQLKKSHIVEMIIKIQNLKHEDINDQMRDLLLSMNKRFTELYGYRNKGLMKMLEWWGDSEVVFNAYIHAIEEKEQREREEQERREREEQERLRQIEEERLRKEQEEKERR